MPSSKLELYVRSSGTGIAPLTRALTGLGGTLGFEVVRAKLPHAMGWLTVKLGAPVRARRSR